MAETRPIPRAEAVARIAAHIESRDSYVITIPPSVFEGSMRRIGKLFGSVIYVDSGSDVAAVVSGPLLPELFALLADRLGPVVTGVAVVPKTAPVGALRRAGLDLSSANEGQDIVMIEGTTEGHRYIWPALFLAALDQVDPEYAAAVRAQAVAEGTVPRDPGAAAAASSSPE